MNHVLLLPSHTSPTLYPLCSTINSFPSVVTHCQGHKSSSSRCHSETCCRCPRICTQTSNCTLPALHHSRSRHLSLHDLHPHHCRVLPRPTPASTHLWKHRADKHNTDTRVLVDVLTFRLACMKAVVGRRKSVGIASTSAVDKLLAEPGLGVEEVLHLSVLTRSKRDAEGAGVKTGPTGAICHASVGAETVG